MKGTNIYEAPLGSLIKWKDYTTTPTTEYIGVLVKGCDPNGYIMVMHNGLRWRWAAYQCWVIA